MIKLLTSFFTGFLIFIIAWADSGNAFAVIQTMMKVPFADKIMHFLLLGTLAFLGNLSMDCRKIRVFGYNFLSCSLLIAIVISAEEFSQAFIPHRNFEILDLVSNYAGIFTFGKLATLYYDYRKSQTLSI